MPGFYPIYLDGKEDKELLLQEMGGDIGSVKEINF